MTTFSPRPAVPSDQPLNGDATDPATAPGAEAFDLVGAVQRGDLDEVEVAWPDQAGHVLGKRIPAARFLDRALGDGFTFCDAALAWNVVGDVVDAVSFSNSRLGYPDAYAVPDLSTAKPVPWRPRTAQVIADIVDHHRRPLAASPRAVLRRVLDRLARLGFTARVGVELEFYLLREDGSVPQEALQCYSLEKANELDPGLSTITAGLRQFLPIEGLQTEYGPAQVEINLAHAPALTAADDAFRLRYAAKELARRAGLLATFMAKPFTDQSGSSAHLHLSLWRDGQPAFGPVDGAEGPAARHAIGGLLRHLPAIALFGAPTVNSYKRYRPGSFAPATASWSGDNRTAAVRSLLETPSASRVELRTPAADANPYWAIAAALAAVAAGLEAAVEPPAKRSGNLYDEGAVIPTDLGQAVAATRQDGVIQEILGTTAVADFAAVTESEWSAYQGEVTEWEVSRYLRRA